VGTIPAIKSGGTDEKDSTFTAAFALAFSAVGAAYAATPLWYQNDPAEDSGGAIISDTFPPPNNIYDSQAADDFKVPASHVWTVKEVDVTGVETNGSPISENVIVYRDAGGGPGTQVVYTCSGIQGNDAPPGSFQIILPAPPTCPTLNLLPGIYWVSVQAKLSCSCCMCCLCTRKVPAAGTTAPVGTTALSTVISRDVCASSSTRARRPI
jgi:hypothetical protein